MTVRADVVVKVDDIIDDVAILVTENDHDRLTAIEARRRVVAFLKGDERGSAALDRIAREAEVRRKKAGPDR